MSHHLDSPALRRDPRLNVTDEYAFNGDGATAGRPIGVWAAAKLATDAGGWRQINRAGIPMMWPLFGALGGGGDSAEYHRDTTGRPTDDPANDADRVVAFVAAAVRRTGVSDPDGYGRAVAARLLPDVPPYRVGTTAAVTLAGFNGRALAGNAPEVMYGLVTNSAVPAGLVAASASGTRQDKFRTSSGVAARWPTSLIHSVTDRSNVMDEFGSTVSGDVVAVPQQLRSQFNNPDEVRVQPLPCNLPGLTSMAVHFGAGARTVPHVHHGGQHLVYVDGVGVVGDENGVHVVRAGDVISSPAGSWHWHGAVPGMPASHVTFEQPGDFDRDVDRRDWDDSYPPDLGAHSPDYRT